MKKSRRIKGGNERSPFGVGEISEEPMGNKSHRANAAAAITEREIPLAISWPD